MHVLTQMYMVVPSLGKWGRLEKDLATYSETFTNVLDMVPNGSIYGPKDTQEARLGKSNIL